MEVSGCTELIGRRLSSSIFDSGAVFLFLLVLKNTRVFQIAKDARLDRTDLHTGRLQTLGDAVITSGAFVRCIIATESGGARIRNQ